MAGPKDASWPPGYDVNDYRTIAVAVAAPAAEGIADIGKAAEGQGAL